MIKVNLIGKKSRTYKGRDWTRIIAFSLVGLFGLYFIGITLYVVISMASIGGKIKKAEDQAKAISAEMLRNSDKLTRFVLTKLILTKIESLQKEKFHYKDYLDQVSSLLPTRSSLTAVGFAQKGWITVSADSPDIFGFETLQNSLMVNGDWEKNPSFSGAYIESIAKDKTGGYSTKLQLELK